ncbi:hypothetical protein [Funiculus sociatus]
MSVELVGMARAGAYLRGDRPIFRLVPIRSKLHIPLVGGCL